MGREARARKVIQIQEAVQQRKDGKRIKLDEMDWFKLQAAHGAIFRTQAAGREKLAVLKQQIDREIDAKQKEFDGLVKKLAKQYNFDAAKTARWDEETQEVIQD